MQFLSRPLLQSPWKDFLQDELNFQTTAIALEISKSGELDHFLKFCTRLLSGAFLSMLSTIISRYCCRCGPARHAIEALRQGFVRATAVDDNQQMITYAQQKAQAARSGVHFLKGNFVELFRFSNPSQVRMTYVFLQNLCIQKK